MPFLLPLPFPNGLPLPLLLPLVCATNVLLYWELLFVAVLMLLHACQLLSLLWASHNCAGFTQICRVTNAE